MRFGERAAELAGYASALLGWKPGEFWNATPLELETALGGGTTIEPVNRCEMERLAILFPDKRDT